MNSSQIQILLKSGRYKNTVASWKLVETHISYVLLDRSFAFKMKKNIKYSFLDFSTLNKRKRFCERELQLNNRLSDGIYLDVVPVRELNHIMYIAGSAGKIIDHALVMKRLKDEKQMHRMLKKKQVTKKHIQKLAIVIRNFHKRTEIIYNKFDQQEFASRFNDLLSVQEFIDNALGKKTGNLIEEAVSVSEKFLTTNQQLFSERAALGYVKDCHGDLHSRNIFLYHKPIIFDCIEFNDEFRQIDILDELAFFCMDLEAAGKNDLSKAFMACYFDQSQNEFGKKEQLLFTYYKCYRANVRAKVNALRAIQAEGPVRNNNLADVKKYLELMHSYLLKLA